MACTECQGENVQRCLFRSLPPPLRTATVTPLTHSLPLPHRWSFWEQYCDSVFVTQYVSFPKTPVVLIAIDSGGNDQVSVGYVTNFAISSVPVPTHA